MNKAEFLHTLRTKLSGFPEKEVEERLTFYSEILDDRIEEGVSEEDAVRELGTVEEIAVQIAGDIPFTRIVKNKVTPKRRLSAWEIVLLTLGSPLWLSLLLAAFAVLLSLYAVVWSVLISLWAVFVSLLACAVVGVVAGVLFLMQSSDPAAVALMGAGLLCAGISVFLFFACKAASVGIVRLTKRMGLGIKQCFVKKEKKS